MKSNARYIKIALAVWGVTLVPVGAFYVLAAVPQAEARDRLRSEALKKETRYADLLAARAAREAGRPQHEIETLRAACRKMIVAAGDATALDFVIGEIAHAKGLQNFSSKVIQGGETAAAEAKSASISEWKCRVLFGADFRSFLGFINELERHEPPIFVDGFTLARETGQKPRVTAAVDLSVLVERGAEGESREERSK
jgi:hypothetical protein